MDINKLLAAGERISLECKKATKSVPNSVWETYSAFANTYGGTILLGICEHMDENDNQRMQNMLRMIGYGENLGSGFPLILHAWNEKHWIKPELIEQPELMQVKLILHIMSEPINSTENKRVVVNKTINEPVNHKLSERQKSIIEQITKSPYATRDEIAQLTGLSLGTLKRELATLKNAGYITRNGSDKTGVWIVLKDL